MTLNEVVSGALKNSGNKFKILDNKKSNKITKFVVECNSVKLCGAINSEKYKWQIRKKDGTVIDESECSVKNTDDVINRIYENINTANKLSKYVNACNEARKTFLQPTYVAEADDIDDEEESEKELLLSDEDYNDNVDTQPMDLQTTLDNLIQKSVDLAIEVTAAIEELPENDIENRVELVSLASNFYGIADDIDDVIDDLYPEEEMDESIQKTKRKRNIKENEVIANKLSEVSVMLRGRPEYKSIREALKLIKSELKLL